MSVKRDRPVAFENAKNAAPSAPSESKSMISRWRSSGSPPRCKAARLLVNVVIGGGLATGSNPRFRIIHARLTVMGASRFCRFRRRGTFADKNNLSDTTVPINRIVVAMWDRVLAPHETQCLSADRRRYRFRALAGHDGLNFGPRTITAPGLRRLRQRNAASYVSGRNPTI